jgi:beta-glucoside operon transcriptional antiterminator
MCGVDMNIDKIINNNIISSTDSEGRELVVMGRGIGFGKRLGQKIDESAIEKVFRMDNKDSLERFKELLSKLPLEYIQLSNDIISYAKDAIGIKLNQNVYLTLTDHISFAIDRFKEGMHFSNALFEEVKLFYPKEYLVGKYALHLIKEKTGLLMMDDEAASIALHLVNAEYDSKISDIFRMTKIIQEMVEHIVQYFPKLQENSMHKDWLVSNLKYLAHRLMKIPPVEDFKDNKFNTIVKEYCEEEYKQVEGMNEFLKNKYECSMTEEEKVYLAVNIKRTKDTYLK